MALILVTLGEVIIAREETFIVKELVTIEDALAEVVTKTLTRIHRR